MPARLKQGKSIARVVAASPDTERADEVVVTLSSTAQGGMLELRALRRRRTLSIMVADLYDYLNWKEARREAQGRRRR